MGSQAFAQFAAEYFRPNIIDKLDVDISQHDAPHYFIRISLTPSTVPFKSISFKTWNSVLGEHLLDCERGKNDDVVKMVLMGIQKKILTPE